MPRDALVRRRLGEFLEAQFPCTRWLLAKLRDVADAGLVGMLAEHPDGVAVNHDQIAERIEDWAGGRTSGRPWQLVLELDPFCWRRMRKFVGGGRLRRAWATGEALDSVLTGCLRLLKQAVAFSAVAYAPGELPDAAVTLRERLFADAEDLLCKLARDERVSPTQGIKLALKVVGEALLVGVVLDGQRELPEDLWAGDRFERGRPWYHALTRPELLPPGSPYYGFGLDLTLDNIRVLARDGAIHRLMLVRVEELGTVVLERAVFKQLVLMMVMRGWAPRCEIVVRVLLVANERELDRCRARWSGLGQAGDDGGWVQSVVLSDNASGPPLLVHGHDIDMGLLDSAQFANLPPIEEFAQAA